MLLPFRKKIRIAISSLLIISLLITPLLSDYVTPAKAATMPHTYGYTYTLSNDVYSSGLAIATDSSGNIYTTGEFSGTMDFDPTAGTDIHISTASRADGYITKINANGTYGYTYILAADAYVVGYSIDIDYQGNIYVTGLFSGTIDFDPTSGTDNHTSSGQDIYIFKMNANGTYGYTYTMGGAGDQYGTSIVTDESGNVFVAGLFENTTDFDPSGATDNHTSAGSTDIFLMKINSNGSYGYTLTMGGTGDDGNGSLYVDSSGNIYMPGSFTGTVDFNPGVGTDNHISNGSKDVFITKINSNASYGYTLTFGGSGSDVGYSATVDSSGSIYITGPFQDTVDFDPTSGTDNHTSNGATDTFLTKINSNQSYGYTQTIGGSARDEGGGILDSSGNMYVAGFFSGTVDFNPGSGVDTHTAGGWGEAGFITRINNDGSYGWTQTFMGFDENTDGSYVWSITLDPSDNIYVTGEFYGSIDFDFSSATDIKTDSDGQGDAFLTRLVAPNMSSIIIDESTVPSITNKSSFTISATVISQSNTNVVVSNLGYRVDDSSSQGYWSPCSYNTTTGKFDCRITLNNDLVDGTHVIYLRSLDTNQVHTIPQASANFRLNRGIVSLTSNQNRDPFDTGIYGSNLLSDSKSKGASIGVNISEGEETTNSDMVSLTLSAYTKDTLNNPIQYMRISNYPDFRDSWWEAYQTTRSNWLLANQDIFGSKSSKARAVFVLFKDSSGTESKVFSDWIRFK